MIESLNTPSGQFLMRGTQVAYVTRTMCSPVAVEAHAWVDDPIHVKIMPGQIKVARVIEITQKPGRFVTCNRIDRGHTYELVLDDGATVSAKDVVVTDGQYAR